MSGIPDFGTVKFTKASFNGKPVGKNTGVKIACLYNSAKVLMASSSQLNAKGNKFSVKFVNSGG